MQERATYKKAWAKRNREAKRTIREQQGDILAIDPAGGESTTGYFLYRSFNSYEIDSFKPEMWHTGIKNIQNLLKKNNIKHLPVEVGRMYNVSIGNNYKFQFSDLIKVVGTLEHLAIDNNIEWVKVDNTHVATIDKKEAQTGQIKGLARIGIKTPAGRTRKAWVFKGQELNEHEKDAVIIFYIFWTKILNKEWPWLE